MPHVHIALRVGDIPIDQIGRYVSAQKPNRAADSELAALVDRLMTHHCTNAFRRGPYL